MIAIFFPFLFLKNFHIIFHTNWTTLHSHQQCIRVPFSLHPHWYLLFLVFLITAILRDARKNLIVSSICISLMTSDIQHIFMCSLVLYMPSSEKCLFSSPDHFNWMVFFLLSLMSLYTFDSLNIWLSNILSYSMPWLLALSPKTHW